VSFLIYAVPQLWPDFNLPRYQPLFGSSGLWFFNPFAWQLLFFIAMVLGIESHRGVYRIQKRRWMLWLCALFILCTPLLKTGAFIYKLDKPDMIYDALHGVKVDFDPLKIAGITEEDIYNGTVPNFNFPWTNKPAIQPVRLLHFLTLVYLVVVLTARHSPRWRSTWARPFVLCGQHALPVFCLSIFLNYLNGLFSQVYQLGPIFFLVMTLAGACSMVGIAWIMERRKRATRQPIARNECG
jgi:hypothetical protein